MENLIESIHNYFTDEFRSQLANSLDETQSGIDKAFSAIIPLSFQRLAVIGENGAEGQNEISRITSDAAQYYAHSPNLSKLHNDERGSNLPHEIFGKDEHGIVKNVAAFAGIRDISANHLLTLALPVIAGKIGQYFLENNISGSNISQFLTSKKADISNSIPVDYMSFDPASKDHNHDVTTHVPPKKKMFPTWVMYTIIILIILLLIYLSRR